MNSDKSDQETGKPVIVTESGIPLIIVTPYQEVPKEVQKKEFHGFMKGTITFNGDIVSPIDEKWEIDKL